MRTSFLFLLLSATYVVSSSSGTDQQHEHASLRGGVDVILSAGRTTVAVAAASTPSKGQKRQIRRELKKKKEEKSSGGKGGGRGSRDVGDEGTGIRNTQGGDDVDGLSSFQVERGHCTGSEKITGVCVDDCNCEMGACCVNLGGNNRKYCLSQDTVENSNSFRCLSADMGL
mmetsp:Transcript_20419/g.41367  ORF Transcript_20419/g.41367 Transcript_20419/m.41367 type:complete len:171 (-) Transcript_20419:213-725(-)|eukprot:CAMPEP_0183297668 /NCGR_PEP_ID=MMETSP0160_2-20130417/4898_1 /TAXON_ID=2839 ORGANISM="Odontella Sinensis, Strain Grunow 1884" /NCGR_SAMPLE_ID=MMETSP0160_2 /ASSEMBLY_ACC=CAM_ASM_000250 /LENGTH=170 /DNA_ID=CAMNT_0025459535 /DNA_START=69 /DNA_END=581 /DNA_ORIENTATION=-